MKAMRVAGIVLFLAMSTLAMAPTAQGDQASVDTATAAFSVSVAPSEVDIDVNYGGGQVRLSGTTPEGTQVAFKVSSPTTETYLGKNGKVLGVLWMTTERAKVEDVPEFFAVFSSEPLQEALAPEELTQRKLDPSFAPLLASAKVVSAGENATPVPASEAKTYLTGLRDARITEGLYLVDEKDVSVDGSKWSASLSLPPAAPEGRYQVTAYAIANQHIVERATTEFAVKRVGVVSLLGNMARNNAMAYGALAITASVVIGLGIGRVFSQGAH